MEISITEENSKIKEAHLLVVEELSEVLHRIIDNNGKFFSVDDLNDRNFFPNCEG